MITREIEVINKFGLHARPSVLLVQTAGRFKADLKLRKGEMEVNGKSIIGVMMLAAGQGTKLMVVADGPDESDSVEALVALFASKFGED